MAGDKNVIVPERPSLTFMIKEVLDALCLENKVKSNKEGSSEDPLETKVKEVCKKYNGQKFMSPLAPKSSYEDPAARLAHVYLHFCRQAYLVNSVMSDAYAACTHLPTGTTVFNEVMKAIDWGRLSVFSLGGGPGADILGILMFLHRHGLNAKVSGAVADKCAGWEATMAGIYKTMQDGMNPGTTEALFNKLSLDQDKTVDRSSDHQKYIYNLWRKLDGGIKYHKSDIRTPAYFLQPYSAEATALAQADIILLPFVLSAIKDNQDSSTAIQTILESMKPGAILVYLDFHQGGYTECINELAYWCGLRRVYFMMDMKYDMPDYEKKDYLNKYTQEFGTEPVTSSRVASIVYKKPSAYEYERRSKLSERERKNIHQAQLRLKKKNPSFRFFQPS